MKKTVALILVLAMLFSLAACAVNHPGAEESEETTTEETTTEETTTEETTTEETTTEETTEETTQEPIEETTQEPSEEANGSLIGSQKGLTYENQRFGIGCKLTEDWSVYSTEELAGLLGIAVDLWDDETLADLLRDSANIYLLYANNEGGINGVAIAAAYIGSVSLDEFWDVEIAEMKSMFVEAGAEDVEVFADEVEFFGSLTTSIRCSYRMFNLDAYQLMIPVLADGYVAFIVLTSLYEDRCEEFLSFFYPLTQ